MTGDVVDPSLLFAGPWLGVPLYAWFALLGLSFAGAIAVSIMVKGQKRLLFYAGAVILLLLSTRGLELSAAPAETMKQSIRNASDFKVRNLDLLKIPAGERDQPHLVDLYTSKDELKPMWVSFDRSTGKATIANEQDGSSHG